MDTCSLQLGDLMAPRQKDEYPNIMRLTVTESAANTFTQSSASTPVIPAQNMVMEICKILIEFNMDTLAEDARVNLQLTARSQSAIIDLSNTACLLKHSVQMQLVTSGGIALVSPAVYDLTVDGKGILYAGKDIYFAVQSVGQGAGRVQNAYIFYKLRTVSSSELIGLIDSFT